jgi:amidophosphoribosyltransferase
LIPDLREKCGVFGVYAPGEDVARLTFFGLHALQHRGQESAGIATSDGRELYLYADMGLVTQIFDEATLDELPGGAAIGHTRYSTSGSSIDCNASPFLVEGPHGPIAFAHNGNVVNAELLRSDLAELGIEFDATTDSEVIAQLLANAPGEPWEQRFQELMRRASGAYTLTVLTHDAVYGARDPLGVRPLCIGRLNGHGWVFASESCALDHLGAEFVREVEPGEVVRADAGGLTSTFPLGRDESRRRASCIFEYIYFTRPDSRLSDRLVYEVRASMGAQLAREHPVEADVVIGVPDSGTPAAIGYARESGIPYAEGLIRNRYVGRTFIQPTQRLREQGARIKYNPLHETLAGKRVIAVDDTIVRGTTNPPVVAMLRRAGAAEVHVRISSPPVTHPCFYGVDMATRGELIAAHSSLEEIRDHVGADSLGYLSIEGAVAATGQPRDALCTACYTGEYPSPVPLQLDKLALETTAIRPRGGTSLSARNGTGPTRVRVKV